MQFLQLLWLSRGGRTGHNIPRHLVLGEGDHLADVGLASQDHAQAVDPGCNPAVGRRAVLERFQHVPKTLAGGLRIEADQLEHFLLQGAVVDPDLPTAHFVVVEHHIVLLAARPARIGIQ